MCKCLIFVLACMACVVFTTVTGTTVGTRIPKRREITHFVIPLAHNTSSPNATQEFITSLFSQWVFHPPCTLSHLPKGFPFTRILSINLVFHVVYQTSSSPPSATDAFEQVQNIIIPLLSTVPSHTLIHCFEKEVKILVEILPATDSSVDVDRVVFEKWARQGVSGEQPGYVFFFFRGFHPLQSKWLLSIDRDLRSVLEERSVVWFLGPSFFLHHENRNDTFASSAAGVYNIGDSSFLSFYADKVVPATTMNFSSSSSTTILDKITRFFQHSPVQETKSLSALFVHGRSTVALPPRVELVSHLFTAFGTILSQRAVAAVGIIPSEIIVGSLKSPSQFSDKFALLSLRESIISFGDSRLGLSWSFFTLPCHHEWAHVQCNNTVARVTSLRLSGLSLVGTIHADLAMLDALRELWLDNNLFSGTLPPSIASLADTDTDIRLDCNMLHGPIVIVKKKNRMVTTERDCRNCPPGTLPKKTAVRHEGSVIPAQCNGTVDAHAVWTNATLTHVIMPFTVKQLRRLRRNLLLWNKFPPCTTTTAANGNVTLILYPNTMVDAGLRTKIVQMYDLVKPQFRRCFASFDVLFANQMEEDEGTYLDGSRNQFERMLKHTFPLHRARYIMLMEPDCVPVRSGWLDKLVLAAAYPAGYFWMLGSVFHGDENLTALSDAAWKIPDAVRNQAVLRMHLNGNAIYNLFDPLFNIFYFRYVREYVRHRFNRPYDLDIGTFINPLTNFPAFRTYGHLFRASDLILNCYHFNYSLSSLLQSNPHTYFAHGGYQLP